MIDFDTKFCGPLPTHPQVVISSVDDNWVTGIFKGKTFEAKVFSAPSRFGINNGRVSKLCIIKAGKWDDMIFSYDRGMDVDNPMGHELAEIFDSML